MREERKNTGFGGWLFLLLVLIAYGVVAALVPGKASEALRLFGQVLVTLLPVLAAVFGLLLAADLLLKPAWVRQHLGPSAGVRGWLIALFGGVLATGPIYPWYALLSELRDQGMRPALGAVFLYSRAIKLPLLPLLAHYFGVAYTVVLCGLLLAFALGNGMLMGWLLGEGRRRDRRA